jgi:aminocarboxymuconate-semialdehyde decarboxylase
MIVDVHAHLAVPEAAALVADAEGLVTELAAEQATHSPESLEVNRRQLDQVTPRMADVRSRLADMDAMGVDLQVVGPMPMHHYWAEASLAERFARTTNEAVAAHCAQAPDRLVGLGTVPLQHRELAITVLRHAVGTLGLKGVSVSTNVAGRELADPWHEPLWAAAAELGALVFIHPWGCTLGPRLAAYYLGNIVGQPLETTIALSHLVFAGVLDRHPNLRLLAAHGGGYLPYYIGRSDHAWRARPDARGCAEQPSAYLRRLWYDALVYEPDTLQRLVAVVGTDQVMLGTDYPFDMGVTDPLARLGDAGELSAHQRNAIAGGNAAVLLSLTEGAPR